MTRSAGVVGALTSAPQVLGGPEVPGAAILRLPILPLPGTARPGAPLLSLERRGAVRGPGDRSQVMGLFDRLRGRGSRGGGGHDRRGTLDRASGSADLAHL